MNNSLSSRIATCALVGLAGLTFSPDANAAEKYFAETFPGADDGPNLVALQDNLVVENGVAYRPAIIGHGFLATEETNYNEGDWTMTVDWNLAPWDMPVVGIGAAIPSNYDWVVGTPDLSVYMYVDTHQPFGQPGKIMLVTQSAGWDRPWVQIGEFVGAWGTYPIKVEKSGDAITFSLTDPNGALMASGTIDSLSTAAPWLDSSNSRLFVGSIRGPNYNANTYWDNFVVEGTAIDSDGDGVPDAADVCPGFDDRVDSDGDTLADGCDPCEGALNEDLDADGICDDQDICPADPTNTDADNDLVCDVDDLCWGNDAAGDSDGDTICDDLDICEGNDIAGDSDGDLYCDDLDNCPADSNGDQADGDADGIGDVCEADSDQDGTIDDLDNCPLVANTLQADSDGDQLGDACDDDDDGDGVVDELDNCALVSNGSQQDTDGDGRGDACDDDDDADAVPDSFDLCPATPLSVLVDETGCSGEQYVAREVGSCSDYSKPNRYFVKSVRASHAAMKLGLLTPRQRAMLVFRAYLKAFWWGCS